MKKIIFKNRWWLIAAAWVYTLTFVFNNYWSKFSTLPSIAASFEKKIHNQLGKFDAICKDTALVRHLATFSIEQLSFDPALDKESFYYLYEDDPEGIQLLYWSNSEVILPASDVPYTDTTRLITYANSLFLLSVHKIAASDIIAVQVTPLKRQYFIANEYLAPRYPGFAGLEKYIDIVPKETDYPVKSANNKPIFYLQKIGNKPIEVFNWPSLFVEIIATVFLIVFFQRTAAVYIENKRFKQALGCIVLGAVLIRAGILLFNIPVNFSDISLFQGVSGSHSLFFPSLGDLLLNMLTMLWILYFLRKHESYWIPGLEKFSFQLRRVIAVAVIIGQLLFTFFFAEVIRQLILHPALSFDVSNFFSLGWNTLLAMICLYFMAVIHYVFLQTANSIFIRLWPFKKLHKFFIIAVAGLIFLTISAIAHWLNTNLMLFVLAWILICFLWEDIIPQKFAQKIAPSANFLFWIIWYALSAMLLVMSQNSTKELEQRERMARKLGLQSDPTAEQLLNLAISSTVVKNMGADFNLLYDSTYNHFILSKIQHDYFSEYLTRYVTNMYLFDASGNPILNKDSTSFETLNTITDQEAKKISKYDFVYYYEKTFEEFTYFVRKPLGIPGGTARGWLFITSTPTPLKRDALVPELLKQLQENNRDYTANNSYAVYDRDILVATNEDYPFTTNIDKSQHPKSQTDHRTNGGADELWFNAGNDRTVVIIRSGSLLTDGITLFAYLFGTFILLTFFERLLVNFFTRKDRLKNGGFNIGKLSINRKIHGTILLVCFISFVVIGFVTIKFFIYRFHQNNTNRLTKAITLVNEDLQKHSKLEQILPGGSLISSEAARDSLVASIKRVAELQNVDVNLFNITGDLVAASQSIIYDRAIISRKMNEKAYYNLRIKKKAQFLQTESIGTLQYSSIYLPVRSSAGKTIGFLNIPYFSSQNDLNQEISNFLVVLINFNAFIFLLAGIIAFFIANNITSSFAIIAEKMKAVALGKNNEPISWDRDDEIGSLIMQYNKMIAALDESAKKLARSERESAWREMAKQVAHEIKNPLTPMKLSLQYLQRAIDNNMPNVKELAGQVATTLVEQINHLSRIASDFSQFAQIDLAKKEIFDLHEVLQQVVSLYEKNRNAYIHWNLIGKPLFIEADKTQINRLFTNLLQNACEASADKPSIDITIGERSSNAQVIISIADKGSGIPYELHDHIFTPNFTTKTSGTGLGLAICRDIVEKSDGEIWFETELGNGTIFFIKLPLRNR
ncbi:MAG: HAMP domain-containing sensor histidine kinase [Chitinophagaceae bacterium]